MFFKFPYTDLYTLNLDWMIKFLKEAQISLEQWQEIIDSLGTIVHSVNGQTGDVNLGTLVNSVNGETGNVNLGTLVNSVNGKTGNVEIDNDDINALKIELVLQTTDPVSTFTPAVVTPLFNSGIRFIIINNKEFYSITEAGAMIRFNPFEDLNISKELAQPPANQAEIEALYNQGIRFIRYAAADLIKHYALEKIDSVIVAYDLDGTNGAYLFNFTEPNETIEDYSLATLQDMYSKGVRILFKDETNGIRKFYALLGNEVDGYTGYTEYDPVNYFDTQFVPSLQNDINALKSALNQSMDALNDPVLSGVVWIDNKYVSASTNQITNGGNTMHITEFLVVPSSTYKIRTNAEPVSLAWTLAFYNSEKEFISGVKGTVSGYNEYTSIPAGTAYVIITHLSNQSATSTVGIEMYVNERLDTATRDIAVIEGQLAGLESKIVTPDIQWTAQKRLDVNGNIINASDSFAISQAFDIENDRFYQIEITGLNGISDGSTISIQTSTGTVLSRAAQNGTYIITKDNLPSNAAILYVCQYITASTPLENVVIKKSYFKRISDIETNVEEISNATEEIAEGLSFDKSYRNILEGATTFTDNKFINDRGNIVSNPNFCLIDGFFPVKPNTSYKLYRGEPPIYSNAGHNWTFWDENKNFLSYTLSASAVTSHANAAYLRFGVYISDTGSATHETFDPTNIIITEDAKPYFDDTFTELASRPTFKGLKWIGIGDSITEANFRATYHYWDYIVAETGLNFVNMGVSGTGYKAEGSGDKAFYKRVQNMATDADVITIFGGVNDVVLSNATIGTETDTGTDTICGCVNTTLDRIEALYQAHMPIGIISPLPCACVDTSVNLHPVQNPADDSCRMAQFVEQLSLICKHRGIPFLDLFHQSNLRPWHQECNAKYFSCESAKTGDGLHPNGHGHRLIYRQILDFVQKIVMK